MLTNISFSVTMLFLFDYCMFNHLKISLRSVFLIKKVGMWKKRKMDCRGQDTVIFMKTKNTIGLIEYRRKYG